MNNIITNPCSDDTAEIRGLSLNTMSMVVDGGGVHPYLWPISQEERREAASFLLHVWADFLDRSTLDAEDISVVSCLSKALSVESMVVFQAQLLADRLKGSSVDLPEPAHLWRLCLTGERPDPIPFADMLSKGLQRPPRWRDYLRPLRTWQRRDGWRRWPIDIVDLEREIISTTSCPLSKIHAKSLGNPVVLCNLYEWFYPPGDEDLAKGPPAVGNTALADDLTETLYDGFAVVGCRISNHVMAYLRDWIAQSTAWIRFYLERLDRQPDRLPKRLWTGSNGNIWNRMLTRAVRRHGGAITVYDHALGANASATTFTPFLDFQDCDLFVTFSEPMADMLRSAAVSQMLCSPVPEISSISAFVGTRNDGIPVPAPPTRGAIERTEVKTILYVLPMNGADFAFFYPFMSEITGVDWQARLTAVLRNAGYRVLLKPHPENRSPCPAAFEDALGATILTQPFEEVYQKADILLYDKSMTTTWGVGLRTDKPVVFVDFGFAPLPPDLEDLLDRRCARVPGWFDENNRAQTDWEVLLQAIEKAPKRRDSAYADRVLDCKAEAGRGVLDLV